MRNLCSIVFLLAVLSYVGCAGTGSQRSDRDRNIITEEEIQSVRNADSVWKLIQILRPTLLTRDRRRVVGFSGGIDALVYINGSRAGTKSILYQLSPVDVERIEYIDGYTAPARYGDDAAGGIFMITIR